jgi:hypothetical protein
MTNKDDRIQEIIKYIYDLPSPKLQEERKEQISNLAHTVINGDIIIKFLVSPVTINNERGIYIYVLTNNRLIILAISTNSNKINTHSFIMSEMQKVVFHSPELNKISVKISLDNNQSLSLEYTTDRDDITSFFQELDKLVKNKAV